VTTFTAHLSGTHWTYGKLYSPQMVVTIYKYTIENDLTKKIEKKT